MTSLQRIVSLSLLLCSGLFFPPAHAQSAGSDIAAVTSTVRSFHVALSAGDAAAAARHLAPDAVVLESGGRETRKEYVGHHLLEDMKFAQAVPSRDGPVDVVVQGDVAWATSTRVTKGTHRSKPLHLAGAELMVLSRTPAGWAIRAIHWSSRTVK